MPMEQLSLFDLIPTERKYPPLVEEVSKKVHELFKGCEIKESYTVWSHVPNLGKRYEAWITADRKHIDFEAIDAMTKASKKTVLEISASITPSFVYGPDKARLMFSTIWTTKGHKEVNQ